MTGCAEIRERYFAQPLPVGEPELDAHLAACRRCAEVAAGLAVADAVLARPAEPRATLPSFDALAHAAAVVAGRRRRRLAARRVTPFALTAASAAMLVGGAWALGQLFDEPPLASHGAVLDAGSGPVVARSSFGARIGLDAGRLDVERLPNGDERLHLATGSVALEVPHLPRGRTFAVQTPDALVSVHGTRFRVRRSGEQTAVWVDEGVVAVTPEGPGRASMVLRAGEGCDVDSLVAFQRDRRREALEALGRGEAAAARVALEKLLATEPQPLVDAEAHVLLARVAAAAGERHAAIEYYDTAMARLPATARPLWADDACAERALLVEQLEPSRAAAAWRDYVARFPDGLHVTRARARLARAR